MDKFTAVKIFFRFFHPAWWVVIALAITLRIMVPDSFIFTGFVINMVSSILLLKVTTIIHECGHLYAAHLCGGLPRRMVLGVGHEIFRSRVQGVHVIIHAVPIGGQAWADFEEENYSKWKYALYCAGGVIANLLVAALVYLIFGFNPYYLTGKSGIDIASALITTNVFCVINLIPFYTHLYGYRSPSDGLMLLQLLFDFKGRFKEAATMTDLHEVYELLEQREFDKAYTIFERHHRNSPEDPIPLVNISIIHIYRGEIEEALRILLSIEASMQQKPFNEHLGLFNNALATVHLVNNNIDQAFHYASLALKQIPRNEYVWATYGAVLIEKGSLITGMQWLFKNMDLDIPNTLTLAASSYLMLAFHHRGDIQSRDKHLDFVQTNIELLNASELTLFERNLAKIRQ